MSLFYSGFANPVVITDALGGTAVYTYGLHGELRAERDEAGRVTRYGYDVFGNRTVITDPLGA